MSKEPCYMPRNHVTQEQMYENTAQLYEAFMERFDELEERIIVLESLTRGMRLPDELDIAGQAYVKKRAS